MVKSCPWPRLKSILLNLLTLMRVVDCVAKDKVGAWPFFSLSIMAI